MTDELVALVTEQLGNLVKEDPRLQETITAKIVAALESLLETGSITDAQIEAIFKDVDLPKSK